MHKKILRILSLALVLLMMLSLLPASETSAAQSKIDKLDQLITTTYKAALKRSGRNSFHGWCASAVEQQLMVLGINEKALGGNGNDQYDNYKNLDYTTGGYRVRRYSASSYDMEEALNAITENGTKDAYNIMLGFQRTNTSAGRKYGHATMIYAIIDGVVYFAESYSTTFNGQYYPEGTMISGTISQVAKYYESWTRYEGLVHFGLKNYADSCEIFPAYLYAIVNQDVHLYSQPCTTVTDDSSQPQRVLLAGERIRVTGLYLNPLGEYWYQVEDVQSGYVRADITTVESMCYDDVQIYGVSAPTELRQGNIFNLKGMITSTYNTICSVRAQVYTATDDGLQHTMITSAPVDGKNYTLSRSTVSNRLAFRLLELGDYRYELAVVVGNNYYADGCLQTEWNTVKLWLSDFRVVSQKGGTVSVQYDACGGTASLNAAEIQQGQTLNTLPDAQRDGYVFDGWYTAPRGGVRVAEDTVISEDTVLYAHWTEAKDATGWYEQDGRLYYVLDGNRIQGFFQVNGITYHQNQEGFLDTGWLEEDGILYYFHANGTMAGGWTDLDGSRYYFGVDGSPTVGWANIDGFTYYFDASGIMLTGNQIIDGVEYEFGDHGMLMA